MAFTKPTRDQVASNENDVSVPVLGEESNLGSPLLGTNNRASNHKTLAILVFSLLAITCFALPEASKSDTIRSMNGLVTCDAAPCSDVGALMLTRGGHAVDAAIATALCLGVVSPTESGIGGGSFMIIYNASTSVSVAIDMREVAPAAASTNMYENNTQAQVGGPLSIAVLGELKGLRVAHGMFGRLNWTDLFQPAINFSKNGFPVDRFLASDIQKFQENITADPGLSEVFAPNGTLLTFNETCYNKKLGETLQAVAEQGPDVLYNGSVGENLIKDIQALGGIITMDDLKNYKPNVTDVFSADILGYKILGMPPPSSGTVGVTMVANVLSNYGNASEVSGELGLHRITEALKHMLGMRMNLGDPAFVDVAPFVAEMTSANFTKKVWHKIFDNTTFPPSYYLDGHIQLRDGGTADLSVVDKERNAVALTTTINDSFGSKILSPSTGIILNNQMRDFAIPPQIERGGGLPPSPQNYIEPGKRPLSSMTPLIFLKGDQLAGVIGGSGGMDIPAAVTQVFINHFVLGMRPRHSVQRPRVYPQLNETDVDYDNMTTPDGEFIGLPKSYLDSLKQKHHKLEVVGYPVSCLVIVQNLQNSTQKGLLTAIADPRKDGKPAAQQNMTTPDGVHRK